MSEVTKPIMLDETGLAIKDAVLAVRDAVLGHVTPTDDGNPAVRSVVDRWLRFDPTEKQGLVIKAGTQIKKSNGEYESYLNDTQATFSGLTAGKDYFVNLADDGTITANLTKLGTGVTIGRFHTLCVAAGTMNMIAPSSGIAVSGDFMVKSYREDEDPDFYAFYKKKVISVTTQTQYDVVTVEHPLSGFGAGDILPESVWCLTWHPECLNEDAMVYDRDTGKAIDVYLQSGKGLSTMSRYNVAHTVSRSPWNHQEDMRQVGKRLLRDFEFTSAAIGSNEKTNIYGSADASTVGGHKDTANRRMISAIGCEEMCGYLYQWLDEIAPAGGSAWADDDGHGSFGQEYGAPYVLLAGGNWVNAAYCGSRCRNSANVRSHVNSSIGGRGASRVCRHA